MVTSRSTPPPSRAKARSPSESSCRSPSGSPSRQAPLAGSSDAWARRRPTSVARTLALPRPPALRPRRSCACGSGHPRSGRDPNTSLPCRQDHIPTPRGGRAPWVSVPGCWTRRTGPLLMSARLYRRAGRRTPDRSRPLAPPVADLGARRRRPSAMAVGEGRRGRRPGRRRCPSAQASSSVGSGTSRSSGGGDLAGRRAYSAVPARPRQQPRGHRRRRQGRGQRPQPVRRRAAPRPAGPRRSSRRPRRPPPRPPSSGWRRSASGRRCARTQSAARPVEARRRRRPGSAQARRPTRADRSPHAHRPRSMQPGGDERPARREVGSLVHVVDHAVVLAAERGRRRAPRRRACDARRQVDHRHAVGASEVRAPAAPVGRGRADLDHGHAHVDGGVEAAALGTHDVDDRARARRRRRGRRPRRAPRAPTAAAAWPRCRRGAASSQAAQQEEARRVGVGADGVAEPGPQRRRRSRPARAVSAPSWLRNGGLPTTTSSGGHAQVVERARRPR